MANAQSSTAPSDGNSNRWLTTAASLVVGSAFFALWFWLLPQWLGFHVEISGHSAMAVAGCDSLRTRIRGRATLHLGFRMDRPWDTSSRGSSATTGDRGFLPVCAEPDVSRLRNRMDRAVDCIRSRQPGSDRCGGGGRRRRRSVCDLLRRADIARQVWRRLRRILPQRESLVASQSSVIGLSVVRKIRIRFCCAED